MPGWHPPRAPQDAPFEAGSDLGGRLRAPVPRWGRGREGRAGHRCPLKPRSSSRPWSHHGVGSGSGGPVPPQLPPLSHSIGSPALRPLSRPVCAAGRGNISALSCSRHWQRSRAGDAAAATCPGGRAPSGAAGAMGTRLGLRPERPRACSSRRARRAGPGRAEPGHGQGQEALGSRAGAASEQEQPLLPAPRRSLSWGRCHRGCHPTVIVVTPRPHVVSPAPLNSRGCSQR